MRKITTLLGLAAGVGALAAAASPAMADNICVNSSGAPGQPCTSTAPSIQAAINAANLTLAPADTVFVGPGAYTEALSYTPGPGQTTLTLRGPNFNANPTSGVPANPAVLSGGFTATAAGPLRIDGFHFTGPVVVNGGVGAPDTTGQVSNNVFEGAGTLTFSGNSAPGIPYEIVRNRFDNNATGLTISGANLVDVRDNRSAGATTAAINVAGSTAGVRVFRNSLLGFTGAGVLVSGTGNSGTEVFGNTLTGAPASASVGVDFAAGSSSGAVVRANRFIGNAVADIRAADATPINAANNWFSRNTGPLAGEVQGAGITATPFLTLQLTAAPTSIRSNQASTITARMVRGDGSVETDFPSSPIRFSTNLGALSAPETGISGGAATTQLTGNRQVGTATVSVIFDQVRGLSVPVQITPGPGARALRLRLGVVSGRRARVGSRVVFSVRANRVVRRQRITLQQARVVGRRTRAYRRKLVKTFSGRTTRATVRFTAAGRYRVRVTYRDGRTTRRSNVQTITVRRR